MAASSFIESAAQRLGIPDASWLDMLIRFESSGNPKAYNATSGAVGLIQFMPRTLKGLGLLPASVAAKIPGTGAVPESVKQEVRQAFLARFPDAETQLAGPVYSYLKQYKPFPTLQSLAMAVFYPAYRSMPPGTVFPAGVRAQNPGVDTVADYMTKMNRRASAPSIPSTSSGVAPIVAGIVAALMFT